MIMTDPCGFYDSHWHFNAGGYSFSISEGAPAPWPIDWKDLGGTIVCKTLGGRIMGGSDGVCPSTPCAGDMELEFQFVDLNAKWQCIEYKYMCGGETIIDDPLLVPDIVSGGNSNPVKRLLTMTNPGCGCVTFYKFRLIDEASNPINPPGFPATKNEFSISLGCGSCPTPTVPLD